MTHVLFWMGTGLGCWALLGHILCIYGKEEFDATKAKVTVSLPLIFLAAAAVAKYLGY